MINFEEELKKFHPSLEVEDAEEAIYNQDLTDMADLMVKIVKESKKVEEVTVNKETVNEVILEEVYTLDDEGPKRIENFGIDTENPESEEMVLGASEEMVLGDNNKRMVSYLVSIYYKRS